MLNSGCGAVGGTRVGGGDLLDGGSLEGKENGPLLGAFNESAMTPFGTLNAEITPETVDFFVSDAEGDPDCPSEGFSSIDQALEALRQGKVGFPYQQFHSISVESGLYPFPCL